VKILASIEVPRGVSGDVVAKFVDQLTERGWEVFQSATDGVAAAVEDSRPLSLLEETVEALRGRFGLSLADMAAYCGVTGQTIRNWINGAARPKKLRVLRELLKACECAPGAASQVRSLAKARQAKARSGKRFRAVRRLTDRETGVIQSLRRDGLTISTVAVLAGVSQASVRKAIRKENASAVA
jgi:DNA-binding transcriptional regulator YiaG